MLLHAPEILHRVAMKNFMQFREKFFTRSSQKKIKRKEKDNKHRILFTFQEFQEFPNQYIFKGTTS